MAGAVAVAAAAPRVKTKRPKSIAAPAIPVSDFVARANAYAAAVVDGTIPACQWTVLACQRHLNDLKRSAGRPADAARVYFRYRFDDGKASAACRFVELMPHTKGEWAGRSETMRLEDFQCFIVCSLFGWVDKADGRTRFQEALILLPRKNGKSQIAAAIGNYKFAAEGEFGAEIYSGATTEKQAWEVFRPAKFMAEHTPAFLSAYSVSVNAKSLVIQGNGSRFEPVIGKPGDGSSPSCAIVDEYHEHADDSLYDTMKTGMGARRNPLLLVITTAGSDRSGPCYALQQDAEKVLLGKTQNDRFFALIYGIDPDEDWKSELALRKANPNYGVSVSAEFLQAAQRDAINSARKQNIFKTKHLNVWVNADVSWMNMVAWDKCGDPNLKIEQFEKEECIIALDLASKVDIASKVRLFRRVIEGKTHYYGFGTHYLNEARVQESGNQHYAGWAHEGRLVVTPGNVTDFSVIADDLMEDIKRFRVRELPHDPYKADTLLPPLQSRPDWNQKVQPIEIQQNVQNFSEPMKEWEALVLSGRFHHDGDPVLGWMVSNVVCHRDAKDNIYPLKQRPENKIDGAVSMIMALNRALLTSPKISFLEERGMRFI